MKPVKPRLPVALLFSASFLLSARVLGDAHLQAAASLPRLSDLARSEFKTADTALQALYDGALANLDTQFSIANDGTVYTSTGNIPAQWLRDSSVQVRPYLLFAKTDPRAADLVKQVVLRQARSLAIDPYANAFKQDYTTWERKFELDSLSYPILLAWTYWKTTGDATIFTSEVKKGFEIALGVMLIEQDHPHRSKYSHRSMKHNPVAPTGMIWTAFRPSDDACVYNFLIPSEMQAVQALTALGEIENAVYQDRSYASVAQKLASEVFDGIQKYGRVNHPRDGAIYAYEVDGLGNFNLMDDANLPSLLSAPYFGFVDELDPVYLNTRRFVLSTDNPFYYSGKTIAGIGSPHTPNGMIWPLALLSDLFTTREPARKTELLRMIVASDAGDHRLHESFMPDDPARFTRKDFGWPNAMFVEFALTEMAGHQPLPKVGSPSHAPLQSLFRER